MSKFDRAEFSPRWCAEECHLAFDALALALAVVDAAVVAPVSRKKVPCPLCGCRGCAPNCPVRACVEAGLTK